MHTIVGGTYIFNKKDPLIGHREKAFLRREVSCETHENCGTDENDDELVVVVSSREEEGGTENKSSSLLGHLCLFFDVNSLRTRVWLRQSDENTPIRKKDGPWDNK